MCSISVMVPSGLYRRLRLRRLVRRLSGAESATGGSLPASAGVLLRLVLLLLLQLVELALQVSHLLVAAGRLRGGGRELLLVRLARGLFLAHVLGLGAEDLHGLAHGAGGVGKPLGTEQ